MGSCKSGWLLLAFLVGLSVSPGLLAADARDVSGSQDFDDLARYPGAWISAVGQGPLAMRAFALGPVERKSRQVRIKDVRRINARLASLTYELPRETALADLVAHYQEQLGERLVYQCSGRDCGRSNDWANTVFGNADLYGPDAQQRYLAADLGDSLLAVYLIQRGNRRVYVHLARYLTPEPARLLAAPDDLKDLMLFGRYTLHNVRPDAEGQFSEAQLQSLQQLGQRLAQLPLSAIFVVCHLQPPQQPADPGQRRPRRPQVPDQSDRVLAMVQNSETCAQRAASALSPGEGLKLLPFGVGPLAPGSSRPRSRIELIVPVLD